MADVRRAGGHVDRGDGQGWVLDTDPAPAVPEPRAHRPLEPTVQVAGGWVLSPPAEPAPVEVPVAESVEESEEPDDAPDDASADEVRAWARETGIEVADRGRLSKEVIDQYLNREK